jgi:hypothetical protein
MQTSTDFSSPWLPLTFTVQVAVPEALAMPEHPELAFVKLNVALIGTPEPTAELHVIVPVTVVPATLAETRQPVAGVAVGGGGGG